MEKTIVSELLIRIGVNPSYRGYPYLAHIICQAASDESSPFLTSKALYQATAEYFHVSPILFSTAYEHSLMPIGSKVTVAISVPLPDIPMPGRCLPKNLSQFLRTICVETNHVKKVGPRPTFFNNLIMRPHTPPASAGLLPAKFLRNLLRRYLPLEHADPLSDLFHRHVPYFLPDTHPHFFF